MIHAYNGNRKGISLVEMIIAIILFATLATISLKYTKNFLNTDLQAMKARVGAAMDQANQLQQAYAIYKVQTGVEPITMDDLNKTSESIMIGIPNIITEMGTLGWELNTSTTTGGNNMGFSFLLDLNGTAAATSTADEQYCQIWNKEFNRSQELNVTQNMVIGDPAFDANVSRAALVGATVNSFCFNEAAGQYRIMVLVP